MARRNRAGLFGWKRLGRQRLLPDRERRLRIGRRIGVGRVSGSEPLLVLKCRSIGFVRFGRILRLDVRMIGRRFQRDVYRIRISRHEFLHELVHGGKHERYDGPTPHRLRTYRRLGKPVSYRLRGFLLQLRFLNEGIARLQCGGSEIRERLLVLRSFRMIVRLYQLRRVLTG